MKKNRSAAIGKLVQAAEKIGGGKKNYGDDRMWKPTVDKSGNGYAVFRFLPGPEGDDLPWAQFWDHGFQGPTGRWYIEKSLTSIGQDDPVSEVNSRLWNSGVESDKEIARDHKRRLHYVSNILVISDPGNPENEGKTFLYTFGKKIFDKVMDVMQPQFEDETPMNPYDLWEGANFKLKIRQVEGYRNYDKSEFDKPEELYAGDEAKLKEVYDALVSLKEFTDPEKYKSYADLKRKLIEVLGAEAVDGAAMGGAEVLTEPSHPAAEKTELPSEPAPEADAEGADTEDLAYFANLAKG